MFRWRIAIQCGVPHPDFLPSMTRSQIKEAQAYYMVEPWGPERDEIHAAMICSEVLRPWSKRKPRLEHFRLGFGPNAKQREKPKSLSGKLKMAAIGLRAVGAVKQKERNKPTKQRNRKNW